jgi:hypothetical protein
VIWVATAAARVWTAPGARRFRAALDSPAEAQARAQLHAWEAVRDTAYGALHARFEDFPLVTWDDMAPWMTRQQAGEANVVTRERVVCWEPTSGSSGVPKLVPHTPSLRRAFTRMFAHWAHDLLTRGPGFRTGKFWFSVSPQFDAPGAAEGVPRMASPSAAGALRGPTAPPQEATGDGAPVGMEDDRDYLAGWTGRLFRPYFLTPPGLARVRDPETWRRTVATFLCAEPALEGMSLWSPTLLHVLLDWMEAHAHELPRGHLVGDWRRLWPELKFVSVWDAGSAASPAARLRERLRGDGVGSLHVQGKGLLATEAPVTIPFVGVEGCVPLVEDVGIELLHARGDLVPLHRAEHGQTYEIVVSQTAGLLRYRLGDLVEVVGRAGATPTLRFLGRAATVDLVGEKLTEAAVVEALARAGVGVPAVLRPVTSVGRDTTSRYRLELDADIVPAGLAEAVDRALAEGHHYRLARRLGQLGPVEAVAAPGLARRDMEAGRSWGGAKASVLRGA